MDNEYDILKRKLLWGKHFQNGTVRINENLFLHKIMRTPAKLLKATSSKHWKLTQPFNTQGKWLNVSNNRELCGTLIYLISILLSPLTLKTDKLAIIVVLVNNRLVVVNNRQVRYRGRPQSAKYIELSLLKDLAVPLKKPTLRFCFYLTWPRAHSVQTTFSQGHLL